MRIHEAQERRVRIERAIERSGIKSQAEAAEMCGVSQQTLNNVISGRRPGNELLKKIAEITKVSHDWLRFGDADKAPSWARSTAQLMYTMDDVVLAARVGVAEGNPVPERAAVAIVGQVTAGNGDIGGYEDLVESVEIPTHWKIVVVHGMSAYPIFYPEQLAWVDTHRGARPSQMTEAQYVDLHDNVVVIQAEVNGKRVGLLKRFNYQPDSPLKFALSSLDAGRSSPYLSPDDIDIILPVVGSWWEDPRKPRKKRFHARSVIVKLVDEGT